MFQNDMQTKGIDGKVHYINLIGIFTKYLFEC